MAIATNFPTSLSDIVLPQEYNADTSDGTGASSIYKTIASLRKKTLSIPNRLKSVLQDAEYVEALHRYLDEAATLPNGTWPLIPNERSGSWPLEPELKQRSQRPYNVGSNGDSSAQSPVSAYFKSTDGHINQWAFSTRRLNLTVLELLGSAGGALLIDTTRRGKAFPDALRRTVPIWTAVWNRILFPEATENGLNQFQGFRLDDSEVAQIESRIPQFMADLKRLDLDLPKLRKNLSRPIQCVWINQPPAFEDWQSTFSTLAEDITTKLSMLTADHKLLGSNVLVCVSASRQVMGAEMSDEGYIQGAGDDSEGWSQGLTAPLFWQNRDRLMAMAAGSDDVDHYVEELIKQNQTSTSLARPILVKPTQNLFLGWEEPSSESPFLVIDCSQSSEISEESLDLQRSLRLGLKDGKAGSKQLREKLAIIHSCVSLMLHKSSSASIYVHCSTGRDLSIGVAVMLLCSFYTEHGTIDLGGQASADKELVKKRLAWISNIKPDANPSRATLQAVNSFLMMRPM